MGRPGRAGIAHKGLRHDPQTLPDRPRAVSKRDWSSELCRARQRSDLLPFLCCCAEATICVSYQFLQCFVGFEQNDSERVHAAENVGIRGISVSQSEPGSVWATQNCARAAQFERQNAKKTHEVTRIFFMEGRTTPVETRKCAAEALKGRENPEGPGPS